MTTIGPATDYSKLLHSTKYRDDEEQFDDYCVRYARATQDSKEHFRDTLDATRDQRLLPAGRQQLAVGRPFETTASNCFVGGTIKDSMEGIMEECKQSALTLRTGGGCGWDFSTLRPAGEPVRGLGFKAYATGPLSFMRIWNSMCGTVMSAGHRRGAMMGVLRVDHPDIMAFINAKADEATLNNFNISVAVTDEFMEALVNDGLYTLTFNGREYGQVRAVDVWARIMERNWDWAEPGVLFVDTINRMNPLNYCEKIAATNPCGEQPLPPYGACLLGSLNIPKYLIPTSRQRGHLKSVSMELNLNLLAKDAATAVRCFDNVIEIGEYPLHEQVMEASLKRRMGIGVTGMANALEVMGLPYGTAEYIAMQDIVMETLRDACYHTSIALAREKGKFPSWSPKWLQSGFAKTLPKDLRRDIKTFGLRNGLLLSVAPTGTISQCADNVSSGIEPPYSLEQRRLVHMPSGQTEFELKDWAWETHGVRGRTAYETSPEEHISVLCAAQRYVDSAVSKTCNVNGETQERWEGQVSFERFKSLYTTAWENGAKGCTTFNINGKRGGIISAKAEPPTETEGIACTIDPSTGQRTCDG